jgi:hypothetical protein
MEKRRLPFGVLAICGLLLLRIVLWAIDIAQPSAGGDDRFLPGLSLQRIPLPGEIALVILFLLTIYGLIRLRRWAWVLVMIITGFILIYDLWLYFSGKPQYIDMLLNVVTVFYLNFGEVQRAFEQRWEESWTT